MNNTTSTNTTSTDQITNIDTDTNTNTNDSDNTIPSSNTLDLLTNMKPLMKNIMGLMYTHINPENNTNPTQQLADNQANNPQEHLVSDESINSVFDMLKKALDDMTKYKERPYLALMPKIFEAMSQMPNNISVDNNDYEKQMTEECSAAIAVNAKKICEMLNSSFIEELCDRNEPEFRESVEKVYMNFNKFLVCGLKMKIKELEDEMSNYLNESASISTSSKTSIYDVLEKLSQKFEKKK